MRVMFVGDSLTGCQQATVDDLGFPRILKRRLSAVAEVEVFVASAPGGTLSRAGTVSTIEPDVDLAVVELGTNDSLHTAPWVFRRQYDDLLDRIQSTSPGAAIVCVGVWRRWWRAWPYDRAIRRSASTHGAAFVRLADLYPDPTHRGPGGRSTQQGISDNFHPNDAGHAAIAARLLPYVLTPVSPGRRTEPSN